MPEQRRAKYLVFAGQDSAGVRHLKRLQYHGSDTSAAECSTVSTQHAVAVCSISDQTVSKERRGKYLAFTEQDSAGVRHLKSLQSAGLSHVHLLPSYDYGSVPERKENQAVVKVCVTTAYRQCDQADSKTNVHLVWSYC